MNAKEKFEKIISDVESLIYNNHGKAQDIKEKIAADLFMGFRALDDVFKFIVNRSLNDYIKERQMMAAYKIILEQDNLNLEEVMALSILDHSSFDKRFKEKFGVTPTEAFKQKDNTKYLPPITWESIVLMHGNDIEVHIEENEMPSFFGVSKSKYYKILEAQEYQALYNFNAIQSSIAFEISNIDKVSMKDAFGLVDDYIEYCRYSNTKDEAFKYLISSSSKKMKRLYFNITKSVIAAMDLIDEAKESGCNINKVDLEYLNVYYDDPYCDFDEFLNQIAKFEELGGKDFEEYWDLIYVFGFTPEMAVRSYNDCN